MGYYMDIIDRNFIIKKENFDKALFALKKVFIAENMSCRTYNKNDRIIEAHFSWVSTENVLKSKKLEKALQEIRYNPIYDENGDICNVEFTGEKYGDEEIFFKALAPYVETNSYLEFLGEDESRWKWEFTNGNVKYII